MPVSRTFTREFNDEKIHQIWAPTNAERIQPAILKANLPQGWFMVSRKHTMQTLCSRTPYFGFLELFSLVYFGILSPSK